MQVISVHEYYCSIVDIASGMSLLVYTNAPGFFDSLIVTFDKRCLGVCAYTISREADVHINKIY